MKPSDIIPETPAYNLKAHVAHVQKLWDEYPWRTSQACADKVSSLLDDEMPEHMIDAAVDFLVILFEQNDIFIYDKPTLEYAPYLTRIQKRLTQNHDQSFYKARSFLRDLYRFVPKETGTLTVPLYDLVDSTFLIALAWQLYDARHQGELLFSNLRNQFFDNMCRASGLDPDTFDGKRKLVGPTDSKLPPHEKLVAYLADTPFLAFLETLVPFTIPTKNYAEHGFLFAKSGHGKTQTMRTILADLMEKDCAIFLIDGLGALIENVDKIASLKDRLVIFDCAEEPPPPLNLFKLNSDDLYFYLFKAIDQTFTARQATMISYLMEFMSRLPHPTLQSLIELCEARDVEPYQSIIDTLSPFAHSFLTKQFFAKKPDQLVQQTKSQIANRLYTLGRLAKFDRMLSGPTNAFDAYTFMQEKKIVLINTDARPPKQGGLGEASSIIGRLFLAQILDAARARPKDERHLALIILDEAKHYLDDHTALILSDARQYGLGLLLASQFPDQLEDGVRKEVINNTSVKFAGPASFSVVAQLHRDMRCEPDFIMDMKKKDYSHAEWACYVDNVTPKAIKLTIPFGAIEKLPTLDAATHAELRKANRERLSASHPTPPPKPPQQPSVTPQNSTTQEYDTDI